MHSGRRPGLCAHGGLRALQPAGEKGGGEGRHRQPADTVELTQRRPKLAVVRLPDLSGARRSCLQERQEQPARAHGRLDHRGVARHRVRQPYQARRRRAGCAQRDAGAPVAAEAARARHLGRPDAARPVASGQWRAHRGDGGRPAAARLAAHRHQQLGQWPPARGGARRRRGGGAPPARAHARQAAGERAAAARRRPEQAARALPAALRQGRQAVQVVHASRAQGQRAARRLDGEPRARVSGPRWLRRLRRAVPGERRAGGRRRRGGAAGAHAG
mmetsp:Transcript_33522/g.106302  ORF Transcript_33522/g.106302 Transcript_33522/m.106302 type:complete len:274 (+) Transcript_33522:230-1051(+)